MAVQAEPKPLTSPLPGGSAGATVAVEPMVTGEVAVPPSVQASPQGQMGMLKAVRAMRGPVEPVPVPAFLVRHPSAGAVLIDSGLHPSIASDPAANLGKFAASFSEWTVRPGEDVASRLRAGGIDPSEVGTVVLTHLHLDHASGITEFPGATFVVSAAEWKDATTGLFPLLKYYRRQQFDHAFDFRTIDYLSESINSFATFGRSFDLFGDGSIVLVSTPGHSAGHQSVVLRLADRSMVVAGDAIYLADQLEPGAALAARPRDRHEYERSIRELALFRKQHPDAVITPGHDPDFYAALPDRLG